MAKELRVQEYEIAERRLFKRYGLTYMSHYFQLKEPNLCARVIEVGAGPPVLLVHDGGSVASVWAPLLSELQDFRLLAVDLPGCGLTDGFNYRGSNIQSHAVSFLEGVLDALVLKSVPIIGNSMGSLWTFWLALEKPERVSAMVHLGCPALIMRAGAPISMRLLSVRVLNQLMLRLRRPRVGGVKEIFHPMGHIPGALDDLPWEYWDCMFRSRLLPNYRVGLISLLEQVLRLTGPSPALSLQEEELRQVIQLALFVWGSNDPFGNPELGRRVAQVMSKAKLEVVSGGHFPWLDQPQQVGEMVSGFLTDVLECCD